MRPTGPLPFPATASLLLLLLLLSSALPTSTSPLSAAPEPDDTSAHVSVSSAKCHAWGFDPQSLSCDTCAVLSSHPSLAAFEPECRLCCQAWRPDPIVDPSSERAGYVGRYRMAVLAYDPKNVDRYEELKNFLQEDRDDVQKEKGGGAFAVLEQTDEDDDEDLMGSVDLMMLMGGRMRRRRKPPRIYFFRERGDGRVRTSEADETVTLDGWKREDIKDMLMTVLP